ncbi:MAG: RNA polymerase sigma factor, partial [Chlorobia bacterium]|nr:RNA polymerase sigma factor [Fimbriimonadaceae bacterium]
RIALNLARDRMRQTVTTPARLSDAEWPDSLNHVEATERHGEQFEILIDAIRSGFERLSPDEREILTLYYLDDWDYADICQALGVSYDVLRTRLVRARKRLREIVGSTDEE